VRKDQKDQFIPTNPLCGTVDDNTFLAIFNAHLEGLADYSTDQRGDVGSWIRTAAVQGLAELCTARPITQELLHRAVNGMLKQGVEKLDNVREVAGQALGRVAKSLQDPDPQLLALFR
jgi:hypothetical protein